MKPSSRQGPPSGAPKLAPATLLVAWAVLATLFAAPHTRAQAGDTIQLLVRLGAHPGEIDLTWSEGGSSFEVYRSASPSGLTHPANLLGATTALGWIDTPPDTPIEFYAVTGNGIDRIAVEPLKPYAILVTDTSSSMTGATGYGPPGCAGAIDTRFNHLKCAVARTAAGGHAVLALARFRQENSGSSCLACSVIGADCSACNTATGVGCTPAMSSDSQLEILTPLLDNGHRDLITWNNFSCGTCFDAIGQDPELRTAGSGSIGGSLKGARRYWQGLQATDGMVLWPAGLAGFDPIRSDPLRWEFLPDGPQCRPYLVLSTVDSDEACATFSETVAAAAALLTTDVDGLAYRIETKPIGIGKSPGDTQVEGIAHAGGAPDVPGVDEGFYAQNVQELQAVLTRILDGAVRYERCNDLDDDCDGLVDEDFPGKGQPCDDGGLGVCRGTGVLQCSHDGASTSCRVTEPGWSPSAEICNTLDDDCDGAVNEGCGGCGGTEVCGNGLDENCNGQFDEGCASCLSWIGVGGSVQIMQYEASRPDATSGWTGSDTRAVCSRPGAQPWTNVTHAQAEAACATVGARLCTEQEWHRTCSVVAPTSYPVVQAPSGDAGIFLEAEDFRASVPAAASDGVARAWVPDSSPAWSGISALKALPDTGANVLAASAPSQSPRLDFEVTFTQTGNTYVWIRMFAPNSAGNTLRVGISTAPAVTAPTQSLTLSVNGTWTWVRSAAFNLTPGTRFVSLYMQEDGLAVDAIHVTRNAGTTPPSTLTANGGDWAFRANPDAYVATICNGRDLDTNGDLAGNQDEIFAAGTVPGGQCYANHGGGLGVFDLSGNVREWAAARIPGVNPIRGGASSSEADGIACAAGVVADDAAFAPDLGFRCCR